MDLRFGNKIYGRGGCGRVGGGRSRGGGGRGGAQMGHQQGGGGGGRGGAQMGYQQGGRGGDGGRKGWASRPVQGGVNPRPGQAWGNRPVQGGVNPRPGQAWGNNRPVQGGVNQPPVQVNQPPVQLKLVMKMMFLCLVCIYISQTGSYKVELSDGEDARNTFTITLVNEVLNGMELVMVVNFGGMCLDLVNTFAASKGFQQNLKSTSQGLDCSFRKPLPVLDFLTEHLGIRQVLRDFKGLKVTVTWGKVKILLGGEDPVIFIGSHVNHPGAMNGSCPSIAAVVD